MHSITDHQEAARCGALINPVRTVAWRERYEMADRDRILKIGLVFQASLESAPASDRSLEPTDVGGLFQMTEVDWVNLQGNAAGRRLAAEHPGIINALDPEIPLDEFAAGCGNRSRHHRRYDGGAPSRCDRPSRVDHGPPLSALGLGHRAGSYAVLSDGAPVSPGRSL